MSWAIKEKATVVLCKALQFTSILDSYNLLPPLAVTNPEKEKTFAHVTKNNIT